MLLYMKCTWFIVTGLKRAKNSSCVLISHSFCFSCSSSPAASWQDKHVSTSTVSIADVWHCQDKGLASWAVWQVQPVIIDAALVENSYVAHHHICVTGFSLKIQLTHTHASLYFSSLSYLILSPSFLFLFTPSSILHHILSLLCL